MLKFYQELKKVDFPTAIEEIAKEEGIYMDESGNHGNGSGLSKGITLVELAEDKGLPVEYLKSHGLSDGEYFGNPCVDIPYRDESGKTLRMRKRIALKAKKGSRWVKGNNVPLMPYGLEFLPKARNAGYLLMVEGESDFLTAIFSNFPVFSFLQGV